MTKEARIYNGERTACSIKVGAQVCLLCMVLVVLVMLEGTLLKHVGKCISNTSDLSAVFMIFAIFENHLHYYLIIFLWTTSSVLLVMTSHNAWLFSY